MAGMIYSLPTPGSMATGGLVEWKMARLLRHRFDGSSAPVCKRLCAVGYVSNEQLGTLCVPTTAQISAIK
jgi:hypothetical protein